MNKIIAAYIAACVAAGVALTIAGILAAHPSSGTHCVTRVTHPATTLPYYR